MKKRMLLVSTAFLFMFFIAPLPADVAFAQIDTTLREYFPTHLGDLWEYEEYNPPFSFRYQVRLTGDTLMPNGRRYYKFTGVEGGFYRIDDSLRVYKYLLVYASCSDSEYLIYDLAILERGIWRTCLPVEGGMDSLSRYIGLYRAFSNFPLPKLRVARDVKQYCDARINVPNGDTTFCHLVPGIPFVPQRLAKGFGLVWAQFEGPPHELDGAIINGVRYGTITSIHNPLNQEGGPRNPLLEQNYPNPFNPATTIRYRVQNETSVSLAVIDLQGKCVKTLVEKKQTAGSYEVQWDATDDSGHEVATGVYFCRLTVRDATEVRKFLFVK
jgi:hypothetical protein